MSLNLCTLCKRPVGNNDLFEFSSPFTNEGLHVCQECWFKPLIDNFIKRAKKKGIKLTVKHNYHSQKPI